MNAKLFLRVTAPAVLIGLVLLGACLAGAWYIHRLQTNVTGLLTQNVRSLQAALELEIRVRQLRFHMLVYLSEPTAARLQPVKQDQLHFEEALAIARQTATTPEQQVCVRDIEQQYQKYRDEQAELRAKVAGGQAPGPLTDLVDPHPLHIVVDPCEELLRLNRLRLDEVADESRTAAERGMLALVLLGMAGPVGGLIMGYGFARGLSRSIYRLSVRVQDLSRHLDQDVGLVNVVADGDLHHLDRQMAHIVRRVEEVAERLQQHQRELIRAEQLSAVGQLAASVAHEVRNPLTGIKMLVEAALRSNNTRPLNLEDLQVIHREIARLEKTVQSFLDFARLPTPHCRCCDLRDVVKQAAELIGTRARQLNVAVTLQLPDAAVSANVDQSQLEMVLVNLFINALDAMPHGGGLKVNLCHRADGGPRVTVSDTGGGIPAHIAARLFTPFTTTKATGTGLGLSLSSRILQEHGGTLTASNLGDGEGACFVLDLPPAPPEAAHADVVGH